MLLAEARDDLRARRGLVPQDPMPDRPLERLHDLEEESVGIQGEGLIQADAHHLPVPGGRVLAGGAFDRPSVRRARVRPGGDPLDAREQAETERLQRRRVDAADGPRRVPQGVGTLVCIGRGVRRAAHAPGIAHDDQHPRHEGFEAKRHRLAHAPIPSCLQSMQSIAHGSASRRSGAISRPHRSHRP